MHPRMWVHSLWEWVSKNFSELPYSPLDNLFTSLFWAIKAFFGLSISLVSEKKKKKNSLFSLFPLANLRHLLQMAFSLPCSLLKCSEIKYLTLFLSAIMPLCFLNHRRPEHRAEKAFSVLLIWKDTWQISGHAYSKLEEWRK